jgi:hypothetical protein
MAIPDFNKIKYDAISIAVKKPRPQFTVIYGHGGLGKTTVACYAPNPVIIPIGRETGQEIMIDHGVPCFENSAEMPPIEFVFGAIAKLLKTEHNRTTAIFDNIGCYREVVDEDVEKDNTGVDLSAFGKRQALGFPYYTRLLAGFDLLMRKKNMNVILLAHDVLFNINLPDGSYYSRTGIAAPAGENTNVRGLLEARAHNVLYLRSETITRKVTGPMGDKKIIGSESDIKRFIYTKPSGTFFAKSRGELEQVYEIDNTPSITELLKEKTNPTLIKLFKDLHHV